ncbi:unnamed protein product [Plasmodium vivax]|uniref:Pv-fam-d protein n=3 Tax=Plasmodium vivax TaxID=5855 RepID=A0A0J9T918_PLAVI|nr:hypothetical protein PVBG_01338 [Plasmodium vivax Brazil I]KMZ92000.1 hypothetical protein PVMG_05486 [Plasmodium vivax Mauritania I]CAG9478288.1 unnamed protein product [Plasmodium vivax]SCO68381.1 Plasmodium exported protein, unknown function [Plasmodium vivax]
MKENNVRSLLFVKVATILLLAYTNQTCNDSNKLGTSLVEDATANGEFGLRVQRLLGGSRSSRDSIFADSFYDDDDDDDDNNDKLFDYDSDHKSRREVKDRHHRHRHSHSHRHKRRHSHKHRTSSRSRREKEESSTTNDDDDEVLSLSRFDVDDDKDDRSHSRYSVDYDDENDDEPSSSRPASTDYDDIIDLTNARRSGSKYRISSMDIELYPEHEDEYLFEGKRRSGGVLKKADNYCENKIFDALSALDKYKEYHGEERRVMKQAAYRKATKVFAIPGAAALSPLIITLFLTTSNVVALPLAASAVILGGILYKKSKDKSDYGRPHLKSITY